MDEKEQKQLLMDLDVVMRSNECKYIVQFYGALFKEVSPGVLSLRFVIDKKSCQEMCQKLKQKHELHVIVFQYTMISSTSKGLKHSNISISQHNVSYQVPNSWFSIVLL